MNRFASVADLRLSPSLFSSVALAMTAVGLMASAIGLRAVNEGFGTLTVGAISAGYYFGFLVGALAAPLVLVRAGHIRSYAAFASLASAGLLLHLLIVQPVAWILIRIGTGAATGGLFVVIESWLNDTATNQTRGRLLSVYSVVCMAALAAGQLLLTLASVDGFHFFVIGSLLLTSALLPVTLTSDGAPQTADTDHVALKTLFDSAPLGLIGLFFSGIAQGAVLGMGAVFAMSFGLTTAQIAGFMALAVIGGLLADWPLGVISDKIDRRLIILLVAIAGSTVAVTATTIDSSPGLLAIIAVLGALTFPLYPLSVAHVNDHLADNEMVPAASRLLAVNGVGTLLGPVLVALTLRYSGPDGFFWCLAASTAALAITAATYATVHRPDNPAARSPYASLPHTATALATRLHPALNMAKAKQERHQAVSPLTGPRDPQVTLDPRARDATKTESLRRTPTKE